MALTTALDELEARRELVRLLVAEYPCVGRVPALARLPRRIAELAGFCLRSWETEHRFGDHPANHYVIATMLGGVYLSQTLAPAAVSRDAVLDALFDIVLRVLQPRGNAPEPRDTAPQPRGDAAKPRANAPEPRGEAAEPRGNALPTHAGTARG
jgi:hypothetical protein